METILFWINTGLKAVWATITLQNPVTTIKHRIQLRQFERSIENLRRHVSETTDRIDGLLAMRRNRRAIGRKNVKFLRRHQQAQAQRIDRIEKMGRLVYSS